MQMRNRLLGLVLFFLSLAIPSRSQNPPLQARKAWIQAVPGDVSDTAAFMTLTNSGKTALQVVGASTPVAAMAHPMITKTKGEGSHAMMGMEDAPALDVPAGGTLVLAPGGDHLMLMGLKRELKPGESVLLTLKVQPGDQDIEVRAVVAKKAPR
jgi:periplasmic copper chaperone A